LENSKLAERADLGILILKAGRFYSRKLKFGGERGMNQTAFGLFDPAGFALTRSFQVAMQLVDPQIGFVSLSG
jgi:hypothetical protein